MFKKPDNKRIIILPLIISFLIISVIANVIFHGITSFYEYKKSVNNQLPVTIENLHFFAREYLVRQYYKLQHTLSSTETNLDKYYLYADKQDIDKLTSDLPASAKRQFIPGHIKTQRADETNVSHFESSMDYRYRGGERKHTGYMKKNHFD